MRKVFISGLAIILFSSPVFAETPEEKGFAIAKEADQRDLGFSDFTANMLMTLKDRHGNESRRNLRIKTLEVEGDGDRSLSIFDNPADVKGTAMLTFTHKKEPDDQWLYLPALKRVKRISSSNKSGSFMGSEFSYEDLSSQEVEKYRYKWLRDEVFEGQDCFVNQLVPLDKKSGYSRQEVWMDKAEYRPLKIVFYDRKNALLKTLVFKNYKKYLGKYWRAGEMFMENHVTGKSTQLIWEDYQFKTGLSGRDFNKNSLKRIR